MKFIFDSLDAALKAEHIDSLFPTYIGLRAGEKRNLIVYDDAFDADRLIEVYRYQNGKYARPYHRIIQ